MKCCKLVDLVNTDSDNNNNSNKNNKQSTKTTLNDEERKKRIATFYDDMAKLQISKSKGLCSKRKLKFPNVIHFHIQYNSHYTNFSNNYARTLSK